MVLSKKIGLTLGWETAWIRWEKFRVKHPFIVDLVWVLYTLSFNISSLLICTSIWPSKKVLLIYYLLCQYSLALSYYHNYWSTHLTASGKNLTYARKMVQINGALNHNNVNPRYRDVLTLYKLKTLYNGFSFKFLSGIVYTTILLGIQKNR